GEHQGGGVPEVLLELDGAGPGGQIVDGVEPPLDVVPLFGAVGDVLLERDVDDGDAGAGDGLELLDVGVLGQLLLDLAGDELLDLGGLGARPGADGDRHAHLDDGILGLGHPQVAVDPPEDGEDQRHPGDVEVLGEVARGVALLLHHLPIAGELLLFVRVAHGTTSTASPSARRPAPWTTMRSPPERPCFTGITRPRYSPRSTSLARATGLPPASSTTNTANRPAW